VWGSACGIKAHPIAVSKPPYKLGLEWITAVAIVVSGRDPVAASRYQTGPGSRIILAGSERI
jgi:hypothetical protein